MSTTQKVETDRPLSIRLQCQWADLYNNYIRNHSFNWINFNFIGFSLEWGGYKGNYFEIEGWIMGFGFIIEWFDYKQREAKVKEWTKDIPEEDTEEAYRKAGFVPIEELMDEHWKNESLENKDKNV